MAHGPLSIAALLLSQAGASPHNSFPLEGLLLQSGLFSPSAIAMCMAALLMLLSMGFTIQEPV